LLPALRLAAVVLVLGLGANLVSLSAAWSVPVAVTAVLAILAVRRGARQAARNAGDARDTGAPPATARGFWSFASARGVSALVEVVLEWIDVIAVAVFLGPAAAGIYGVVNRCVRLGTMLEHTARIVTGPMISAALAVRDLPRAREIFSSTARFLVLAAWPFYLTLIVFAPAVLDFFGPGFRSGAPALQVISATMMLAVSAGGVQSMLLMGGRSRWQLINKSAALAVAVVLNLWLVPRWGLMGAVTAWSAAVAVDYGMAALQVSFGMRIRAGWRAVVLPAVLALAVFGAGSLAVRMLLGPTPAALLLSVAVGGAVYAGLAVLWRRPLGLDDLLTRLPGRARPVRTRR
jgi:O-antigen/teichoic acid export membrane protein